MLSEACINLGPGIILPWYAHDLIDFTAGYMVLFQFTMTFERKAWWYVVNIILPTMLMVLLVLMMFWLPADSGRL